MTGEQIFGGDPIGALLFVAIVSLPLAVALSFLLLGLYRRAVTRNMGARAGEAWRTTRSQSLDRSRRARAAPDLPAPALSLLAPGADLAMPREAPARVAGLRRRALGAAGVYAVAGLLHAAIATVLLFRFEQTEFLPVRTLFVWFVLAWPVVPTVMIVAVGNRWLRAAGVLAYFVVAVAISPVSLAETWTLWLTFMGVPTLLMLAVSNRRLRAVGPITLAVTVVVVTSALIAFNLAARLFIGSGGAAPVSGLILLGLAICALFAAAAVLFFRWIAGRYRRRRASDQTLLLDAWWLIFTFWECLDFATSAGARALLVILAFVAYKAVTVLGLRLLAAGEGGPAPATLLLLRVFGLGRRSERLLDELGHKWRYGGDVNLIAATDLAGGYLEPSEFWNFVTGRLAQSFIKGEGDLEARLAALDRRTDPDGRHRVNEFFCHADTWQRTMRRLARESDAVLMDLRRFSRDNAGCIYELEQLMDMVPLARVVFLVDGATDTAFLAETLERAWAVARPGSPNRATPVAVRLFQARRQTPREVATLMLLLFGAEARG